MAPGGRPHYTNDSDDETERARKAFEKVMPPGYRMEIGGERAKEQTGFANLAQVLAICLLGIYGALLLQFGNAVKPLLVFAATPYGVVGALLCLIVMGSPFGFMAFLGIASLIGVIVSHVIVLFDFIKEMHEKGEPFEQAIRDAGIERLRPVLITVGATILALFPLASHGGPLWKPFVMRRLVGWRLPPSSRYCLYRSSTALQSLTSKSCNGPRRRCYHFVIVPLQSGTFRKAPEDRSGTQQASRWLIGARSIGRRRGCSPPRRNPGFSIGVHHSAVRRVPAGK
jgi:hypothetical protein